MKRTTYAQRQFKRDTAAIAGPLAFAVCLAWFVFLGLSQII